jgi:phenylalanyl-tRNA synthetase alpha chain
MKIEKEIDELKNSILKELEIASTTEELEKLRIKYLGRKGTITERLKNIKNLKPEDRPFYGKLLNQLKAEITTVLEKEKESVQTKEKGKKPSFDYTMPGDRKWIGHLHPLTITMNEVIDVFLKMGFSVEYGPDVETDFYNFEALNFPPNHPSRDTQDTFYLENNKLLRTHTSPVQIRTMENSTPPIRIIAPGRCYRVDAFDSSHSPVFHQVEGLYVDKNVTLADLKATLDIFAKGIFGASTETKLTPHYFPFTEPSAEMHVQCLFCYGKGCSTCKHTGWIEIIGCGMVHPEVFKSVGYDADKYTGFAFGMGIDRICMLKYGINDMRLLFDNDLRFIQQF